MIQDTLHKLQELQEILAQKYQIENELKEIPKALSTKEELVSRLKQSYIDHNDRLTSGKKTLGELRIKMDDAEHGREELEEKMGSINTQREYETLVKDIQFASEREQDMRKEVQKEEKSLDELQQTIESEESLITEQTKELEAEQQKIYTETEKRKEQLDELDKLEADITPEMDKEIIFKFKRIIRSKGGQGIVPLRSSVCSGCNMILPTQFVNEVKAEIKIHFCPYCSMILYFQPDSGEVSINFDTSLFGDDIPDDNFDEIEDDIFADETEENDEGEEDELSSN
ncbi:MAG: zinc ribbon domain-containing protein, partial [Salinispira sp.]